MTYLHGAPLVAAAKSRVGARAYSSMCQAFCLLTSRTGTSTPDFDRDGDHDAVDAWKRAKAQGKVVLASSIRSYSSIPAGTLAYWTGGSHGYGHVAITIGGGKVVSTDAPTWGRIGIVDIGWISANWRNGLTFVGYIVVDGDGHKMVDDAITTPARPATKPRAWFGIDMRNLAGFNDHGAATFDKRLGLIVEDIRTVGREVVCVLELPNGKVDDCTKRMKSIGYVHAAGDLGRHVYVKQNVSTSGAKLFDLTPRLHADTKQGVAVEVRPGKTPALIVTAQLENEDASGDTQVGQARNLLKQALDYAAQRGIVKDRVFFAVDTNSDNRVRTEVFEAAGYFDVFDTAYSSENSAWRSFVGWVLKPTRGKRIDLIAAYKTRPVRRARLRLTTRKLSDHLDLFADIGTK